MNLEHLIEKAIIDIKYYQGCLREAETKLDAFYIAQDAKADNGCGQHLTDCIK